MLRVSAQNTVRENTMKGLISILALSLVVAFTAPAFAGAGTPPETKADCEKANMKWNDATSKCEPAK
jgi:hypothetical protein